MEYIEQKTIYINRDELTEIRAIEHDIKTRFIDFKFIAGNKVLDISQCLVRIYALTENGNEIFNNLIIIDGIKGIARLELTDSLLTPGTTTYILKIYGDNSGILSSNRLNLIVDKDLMTGNGIEGTNEYKALDEALKTVSEINSMQVSIEENKNNIASNKKSLVNFQDIFAHKIDDFEEELDKGGEVLSKGIMNNTETVIYNLKMKEGSYGDCIVIKADDGSFSMIDCGMEENYPIILEQLNKIGVDKIKYFFATHDHSDHIGNAPNIISKYKPTYLVYKDGIDYSRLPSVEKQWDTEGYHNRMLQSARDNGTQLIVANDQVFTIGREDKIQVFAGKFYDDYTNLNSFSVNYLLLSHGTKSLFPGDSTQATETFLHGKIGKVDLYKLSHHGADGGNTEGRFGELQARYCISDRLDVYKTDIMHQNAIRAIKHGGKEFTNDNNDITVFKITKGAIYPACNEYPISLKFIPYDGKYKMTNESGNIAVNGLYTYKTDTYYVKPDGFVAINEWVNFGGVDYHAGSSGALDRECFIQGTNNGETVFYWLNAKGEMVKEASLIFYNNNLFLIKDGGFMASAEFMSYQGHYYYALTSGALVRLDWVHKDEKYYWMKVDGVMACNETLFIEGKWYDFDSNGYCTNQSAGRDTK